MLVQIYRTSTNRLFCRGIFYAVWDDRMVCRFAGRKETSVSLRCPIAKNIDLTIISASRIPDQSTNKDDGDE